jgi:glucose-1-phosphate adenylyltransferase
MHDTSIGEGAVVDHAIIDKQVRVGRAAVIGHGDRGVPNRACPEHLSSGLALVGKGADIPEGLRIGRNTRIGAFVTADAFTNDVPSGGVVDGRESMH